jgi:hypothetical protein
MGHWQRGLLFFFVIATMCQRPCFGGQNAIDKKWSLTFKNASVSQVLDELTRVTGINIFANKIPEGKTINKSYKDQTIDQIVRDLYRGSSFALVWNDGPSEAGSLDIRVFDGDSSNASRSFTPMVREFPTPTIPPVRHTPGRPNAPQGEDSEAGEDIPESEEPEDDEEPSPPPGNEVNSQDESSGKLGNRPNPATGVPHNESADKGEQEDE